MAYTDERAKRPSPASITGAVAINALMVAGVIFAAPEILPKDPWTRLITYGVPTPPPPKPDDPIETPTKPNAADTYVPPPPQAPQPPPGDNLVRQPDTGLPPAGSGFGETISRPPADPPPAHIPVLTGARVNPRYAGMLQPEYPPGMIREGREGVVVVRVLIGTDGRVKALEPLSSDGEAFLAATRKQAMGKWRFLPATRDGEAVEAWREMTVRFRLPD